MNELTIPTDDEVRGIMATIGDLEPAAREKERAKLRAWRDARVQRETQEREDHFRRVYTDEGYFNELSQNDLVTSAASVNPSPKTVAFGAANRAYLAHRLGRDLSGEEYQVQRDGYAKANFAAMGPVTDEAFFQSVRGQYETEIKREGATRQLQIGAISQALKDSLEGKATSLAPAFQQWAAANRDLIDDKDESQYLVNSFRMYRKAQADIEKFREPASRVWQSLTNLSTGKGDDTDILSTATQLAKLSREDRSTIYGYSALAAEANGIERDALSQMAKNLGESISRSFNFIPAGSLAAQEDAANLWRNVFKSGDFSIREDEEGNKIPVAGAFNAGIGKEGYRAPTDEEKAEYLQQAEAALPIFQVIREMRAVGAGQIDPTKPVLGEGLAGTMERGAYALAGSSGLMAATAANPLVGVMAYRDQEFDRIMLENPDMDRGAAKAIALAEGGANALIDKIQLDQLPVLAGLVRHVGTNGWRGVGRIGQIWVTQSAQELAQNAISPVTETIAAALREDMADKDIGEEALEYFRDIPETLAATGWMALIGGGLLSVRNVKNPMTDIDQVLLLSGFSKKQADRIKAAKSPDEFDQIVRDEIKKRSPDDIANGIAAAQEMAGQADADQSDPAKPTLSTLTLPDGTTEFTVTDASGNVDLVTKDQDAAREAYVETARLSAQREILAQEQKEQGDEGQLNAGRDTVVTDVLNKPSPETGIPVTEEIKAESGIIAGSALEKWADEQIKEGRKRLNVGLDPVLLSAYSVKGAAIIERGIRDFAAWSAEMIANLGESIRPNLKEIYDEANKTLAAKSVKVTRPKTPPRKVDREAEVTAALDRLKKDPEYRMQVYDRMRDKFNKVASDNRAALSGMQWSSAKKSEIEKQKILHSLGELDALLSVLPPEVRGKVGGYSTLAKIGTGETALADFFVERIGMIEKEMEEFLRKEYLTQIRKLIAQTRPRKGDSGVLKSTLGAEAQDIANKVRKATYFDTDETALRMTEAEALLASGKLDAEKTSETVEWWGILNSFGDLEKRSAASLAEAAKWFSETMKAGRSKWRIQDGARVADYRAKQQQILSGMKEATRAGLLDKERQGKLAGAMDMIRQFGLSHFSFEQFLRAILPDTAASIVDDWSARMRKADNASQDLEISGSDGLMKVIRDIAKSEKRSPMRIIADLKETRKGTSEAITKRKVTDERISIELAEKIVRGAADSGHLTKSDIDTLRNELASLPKDSRKEFVTIKRVIDPGKLEQLSLSKADAIQLLLSWRQKDVQDKMRREGWTDTSITQLQALTADPASQAAMSYLQDFYAKSRDLVNPVYSRMFGMSMPQVENYAPTRYRHSEDAQDIGPDGTPAASSGVTPGFAKSRTQHSAEMRVMDAFTVYQQHVAQQAHWANFAEFHREVSGVLKSKDVRDAMEQAHGLKGRQLIDMWLEMLAQRGGNKAREAAWLNGVMSSLISGKAVSSLGGSLRTIAMQIDSAIRFSLALTPRQMVNAVTDVPELIRSLPKVWNSDTIQRRLKGGTNPEVRFLIQQERENPGWMAHIANQAMLPMQYFATAADALSSAVVFRDAYKTSIDAGEGPTIAEARALDAMDAAVYRFSQPVSFGAKSLIENQGNILMKSIMLFMSDPRLKTAIIMDAVVGLKTGKGKPTDHIRRIAAVELMALVSHVVASMYRDAFSDETDEEIWSPAGFARALLLAPLQGFFLLGAATDTVVSKLLGLGWWPPSRDPIIETTGRAVKAAANIDDLWNPESSEDFWRELDNIARAMAISTPMAAPATILNVLKPIRGAISNAESED